MRWFLKAALAAIVLISALELALWIPSFQFEESAPAPAQVLAHSGNVIRVACIGESTTAAGNDDSYPARLEARLNQDYPDKDFEVINWGDGGANSKTLLDGLPGHMAKGIPDVAVLMVGVSDHFSLDLDRLQFVRLSKWRGLSLLRMGIGILRERLVSSATPAAAPRVEEFVANDEDIPELPAIRMELANKRWMAASQIIGKLERKNQFLAVKSIFWRQQWTTPPEISKWLADELIKIRILIPDDPDVARLQAKVAKIRHVSELDFFQAAVDMGSTNSDDYSNLARLYEEEQKWPQAEAVIERGLNLAVAAKDTFFFDLAIRYYEGRNNPQKAGEIRKLAGQVDIRRIKVLDPEITRRMTKGTPQVFPESLTSLRHPKTAENYLAMVRYLRANGVKVIAMQYATVEASSLRDLLKSYPEIPVVENVEAFRPYMTPETYYDIFTDKLTPTFGHMRRKGNDLLAANLSPVIGQVLNVR